MIERPKTMTDSSEKKLSGESRERKIFHICNIYVMELALRSALLAAGIAAYVWVPEKLDVGSQFGFKAGISLMNIMWLLILLSMLQKFFPQAVTSIGSRKHFKALFHRPPAEYFPGEDPADPRDDAFNTDSFRGSKNHAVLLEEKRGLNRGALRVLLAWIALNALIGAHYFTGVIDRKILILLVMFYFVSDTICVLIYCPFQRILMKNRCCVTCRIFNWDSMMLCTPLLFMPGWFSLTLCFPAWILFVHWEMVFNRHPERFSERFNLNLRCAGCGEKLCRLKDAAAAKSVEQDRSS